MDVACSFMELVPEQDFDHYGLKWRVRMGTNDADVIRCIEQEYRVPDNSQYEPGSVSLDIGAHIGAYSMWACSQYTDLKVIAVEPLPENARLIRANRDLNGFKNRIIVLEGSVGSAEKISQTIFYTDPCDESGEIHHFIGNAHGQYKRGVKQVDAPIFSLATLLYNVYDQFKANKIWCVKLDCEGSEVPFLAESYQLALKSVKWFVGEYHFGLDSVKQTLDKAGFIDRGSDKGDASGNFCFENPTPFSKL